jgi:hypothetical protein
MSYDTLSYEHFFKIFYYAGSTEGPAMKFDLEVDMGDAAFDGKAADCLAGLN